MDEAPNLLEFFFLDELQRIEILDFSRDGARDPGGVEQGDALHAVLSGKDVLPCLFSADAKSTD